MTSDFKLIFEFDDQDIYQRPFCSCCRRSNLRTLSSVSALSRKNEYKTYLETSICRECGHIERRKIPSEKWMLNMFKFRDVEQVKSGYNPINNQVEEFRYDRYKKIGEIFISELADVKDNDIKIIDIGCGTGMGIKAWMDLGLNSLGIEPDISRARFGINKGINIITKTFQEFDFKSSKRNIFTSIQSLEHFYNEEDFISCIYNNMSEDSILYIEVPNAFDHISDWQDSLYLGHVHNFCENSLLVLLQRLGFKSIKRVFPYVDKEFSKNNISVLAMKGDNYLKENISGWNHKQIDNYIDKKIKDSKKNLPSSVDMNNTVKFKIDKINDLMFSFRGSSKIKSSVKDNQQDRILLPLEDNQFEVRSTI